MQDLRCASKKHAVLTAPSDTHGVVEVKCDSAFCGAQRGMVVLHQFSTETGLLLETHRYKNPGRG
jgi:hypothetical protein